MVRSSIFPGLWQESKVHDAAGARENCVRKRGLICKCPQLLKKRGKAARKNGDFEDSGFGRSFEKKRNGLAEVVPKVGAFGFVTTTFTGLSSAACLAITGIWTAR